VIDAVRPSLKWRKLGKIFDPAGFALPNHCEQFAQAPQALVFEEFTRIYFSSRERDPRNGKYLSHVLFADFSKDFRHVIRVSDRSVIELGKLGCFDEHGIFPMNVLRHRGKIYGYTCGWSRRTSVSVETSVGLAVSDDDGLTFRKIGDGPILTSSLHEPFLVGDGFVLFHGDQFHMWYIFGTAWNRPRKTWPLSAPTRSGMPFLVTALLGRRRRHGRSLLIAWAAMRVRRCQQWCESALGIT